MSEETKPQGVTIPAGETLRFEAPLEGGTEWQLRNTVHGLVIECDPWLNMPVIQGRPIFRLTPEGVSIRGNLSVDGEIGRAFDCHKFCRRWEIKAGNIPSVKNGGNKDYAIIELGRDGRFELTYERNGERSTKPLYLFFNPRTGTLDTDPKELEQSKPPPHRSISFWDGKSEGSDGKHRIFAMRTPVKRGSEDCLLPWECKYDEEGKFLNEGDESWGAEEGGG